MGPIPCPETSVNNYHTTLRNIPGERRSPVYYIFKGNTSERNTCTSEVSSHYQDNFYKNVKIQT
jgi:hypothetical protein